MTAAKTRAPHVEALPLGWTKEDLKTAKTNAKTRAPRVEVVRDDNGMHDVWLEQLIVCSFAIESTADRCAEKLRCALEGFTKTEEA